MAIHVVVIIIW